MSYNGPDTTADRPLTHHMEFGEIRDQVPSGGRTQNVAQVERIASGVAGGALVAYGLRRRSALGYGIALLGGMLLERGATGHCRVYDQLGIDTAREDRQAIDERIHGGKEVEHVITINKPVEEIFRFWRSLENLPRFMKHLEAVTVLDDRRSHWRAKAPMGRSIEWDAEILNERENELIAWQSLEGSEVDSAGSVRFQRDPSGRGTTVRVKLRYNPPGGRFGALVAKMLREEPSLQVPEDMRRLKALLEAGEIPTIEGQPRGTCA
jgi:uncharacterized membrane protein